MAGRSACILGCAGPRLGAREAAFFHDADPWGFILFARNVENPRQLRALTAALRDAVGRDAPILVDQEGGRVQRLGPPHWPDWPPPLDQAQAVAARGGDVARSLWLRYALIGADLRASGIDVNCAPLADVAGDATHPFLRNRCYGTSPADVTARARAVADGLLVAGVLPVVKHMPGHGRGTADSHSDLPVVDVPRDVLDATDFAPFRALSDLSLGMTAHVVYSAVDAAPGTVSAPVIDLIRRDIGFGGLLMTDDISMQALGGAVADRAARAIAAGCDVALHCNGDMAEMEGVVAASGRLDAAVEARAEASRVPAAAGDVAAWRREWTALSGTPA